ncbi:unnamed protein product [Arabidopsis lyrata]|uniref:uncharacterized protein LOC9320971 n=1 Tax=Arabidopsis lyrata subsp. lyrata TaxID=81972 RepID=UPI000A29B7F0|nr:uncharacterized protein LOC9320971 [Arabidopsis lyrata subsp. lyrata]CAH8260214.1 unnamed protein product [Arabidopsis lyrata]|eukprot:XP_020888306.1 uncharacterized protein LOC9320971 [Arabidopsis lyrata subsp. lyrata]
MALTIKTIGSFRTHQKHLINFFGDDLIVTVTPTATVIRRWIRSVRSYNRNHSVHPLVVGIGVRSDPDPSPKTLQLCVGSRCLIIQLGDCYCLPNVLRTFLSDPNTTFVGVWNGQDQRKLATCRHQLEIGKLLDIRLYVIDSRRIAMRFCSFEQIVKERLGREGVRLDPAICMSDWGVYMLSHDQVLQASIESCVCFKLAVEERLWELKSIKGM